MRDYLASAYIDDEMDLDEKAAFIRSIRESDHAYREAQELLAQERLLRRALMALTGQGGWPLSVFLTPEGKPFYGGTYFPPTRRYNMPSFMEVLESVQRTWLGTGVVSSNLAKR